MRLRAAVCRVWLLAAVWVLIAGCSAGDDSTVDDPADGDQPASPGVDTPSEAVDVLVRSLGAGDMSAAAAITVDGQELAIAVSEGASATELAAILDRGSDIVVENFWASFVAGVADLVDGGVTAFEVGDEGEVFEIDGMRFVAVDVRIPGESSPRPFVAMESNGWKVDVVATFAQGLAPRLGAVAEVLEGEPDGGRIFTELAAERVSLEAALENPDLVPAMAQVIRSAVVELGG